jgi:hypothetical protein
MNLFEAGCALGAGRGIGQAIGGLFDSPSKEAKELAAVKAELKELKREIAKRIPDEDLAASLRIHPSRLPAAKRVARALGIHASELPTWAAEYGVSPARVIGVYSKKTRRQVLAEEAEYNASPLGQNIHNLIHAGRFKEARELAANPGVAATQLLPCPTSPPKSPDLFDVVWGLMIAALAVCGIAVWVWVISNGQ